MNPIETAVAPLKDFSIEAAAKSAEMHLDRIKAILEKAGWDLEIAAPYPKSNISRKDYVLAKSRRMMIQMLTQRAPDAPICRRPNDPAIVVWNAEYAAKFVVEAKRDAAEQYDAYVAKLNAKVGAVVKAVITYSSGVWNDSLLTITKADGTVERWKTSCIINCSVLGKQFNQWPTRKIK